MYRNRRRYTPKRKSSAMPWFCLWLIFSSIPLAVFLSGFAIPNHTHASVIWVICFYAAALICPTFATIAFVVMIWKLVKR